jgi:hypothetical protein
LEGWEADGANSESNYFMLKAVKETKEDGASRRKLDGLATINFL